MLAVKLCRVQGAWSARPVPPPPHLSSGSSAAAELQAWLTKALASKPAALNAVRSIVALGLGLITQQCPRKVGYSGIEPSRWGGI